MTEIIKEVIKAGQVMKEQGRGQVKSKRNTDQGRSVYEITVTGSGQDMKGSGSDSDHEGTVTETREVFT